MKKSLAYYRVLPYARYARLYVDGDERYWVAWVEGLPGCQIDGSSKAEACAKLVEVFDDYIQAKLEWDSTIPEPARPWCVDYKGDFEEAGLSSRVRDLDALRVSDAGHHATNLSEPRLEAAATG